MAEHESHHHHDHAHDHEHAHEHPHAHDHAHGHAHDHGHGGGKISIFGHDHGPHHHHDDDPAPETDESLDPASRSLADALRISFSLLKWIMVALVAVFFFSGWFYVQEGEVAVLARFGQVVGSEKGSVREAGGPYFAWPRPVDQVVFVPVTEQQLQLDKAFWFEVQEADRAKKLDELPAPKGGLAPGRDGSLLTGDRNVVHARWSVSYRVAPGDAVRFLRNVGLGESRFNRFVHAQELVRAATEQAVVHVAAQTAADDFRTGKLPKERLQRAVQASLNLMNAGLTVTNVSWSDPTPPLALRKDFEAVSEAESQKAQKIEEAQRYRSKLLHDVAGEQFGPLLEAIAECDRARARADAQARREAEAKLDRLILGEGLTGRVAQLVAEARAFKRDEIQKVRSEAETFQALLPRYEQNPRIVRTRSREDAVEEVFAGDVETFYLPPGSKTVYLELGRDPELQRQRVIDRYKAQQGGTPKP